MVKTNAIPPLGISSNSAGVAAGDIRGIKAPMAIPNVWLWVGVGLAVLALGALAWWWWRRRQARAAAPVPVKITPPDEKARAKLQEALQLLDQPRPFCILVSDTIRVYLEERFNLHAPERTTEEFLEELQASALLSHEQKQTLGEFLMRCDLVKFARYEPGPEELQGIYDVALRLVEETKAPPVVLSTEQPAVQGRT
jgi:hypothetical protein